VDAAGKVKVQNVAHHNIQVFFTHRKVDDGSGAAEENLAQMRGCGGDDFALFACAAPGHDPRFGRFREKNAVVAVLDLLKVWRECGVIHYWEVGLVIRD
jgi:hypothetical protein